MVRNLRIRTAASWSIAFLCVACLGCVSSQVDEVVCDNPLPRELEKTNLPPYRVAPPDILLIDAVRVIPLPPYRVAPLDALVIQVSNSLQTAPINGLYVVDTDGTVNLGLPYGQARLVGKTLVEAQAALVAALKKDIVKPEVQVSLAQSHALQQLRGEHLVRPDGTVGLGTYGNVNVAGMTLPEIKAAIETQLSTYLLEPEVSVDVFAYNSKAIFVIFDGAGSGQSIVRLPVTRSDTVLDAISQVNGLSTVADKRRIWVARPVPAGAACDEILPVDWAALTKRGRTETNYQLFPGDRLYVAADPLITVDNLLAKILSPIERLFGVTLLGEGTIQSFRNNGGSGNGGFGL